MSLGWGLVSPGWAEVGPAMGRAGGAWGGGQDTLLAGFCFDRLLSSVEGSRSIFA